MSRLIFMWKQSCAKKYKGRRDVVFFIVPQDLIKPNLLFLICSVYSKDFLFRAFIILNKSSGTK